MVFHPVSDTEPHSAFPTAESDTRVDRHYLVTVAPQGFRHPADRRHLAQEPPAHQRAASSPRRKTPRKPHQAAGAAAVGRAPRDAPTHEKRREKSQEPHSPSVLPSSSHRSPVWRRPGCAGRVDAPEGIGRQAPQATTTMTKGQSGAKAPDRNRSPAHPGRRHAGRLKNPPPEHQPPERPASPSHPEKQTEPNPTHPSHSRPEFFRFVFKDLIKHRATTDPNPRQKNHFPVFRAI